MQTTIGVRFALLMIASAILAACAADQYAPMPPPSVPPPSSFAHRAVSPNIELFWNCSRPRPATMSIAGAVRNIGKQEVRSVLLTVRSLRVGDAPILLTAEALPEIILYAAGPSPFQIDLPMENAPSRIDIISGYRMTPGLGAPDSAGPQGDLTIEDACAPTRHPNTVSR